MPTAQETIRLYQQLARLCDRLGQPQMRDCFLVLASDAAFSAGQADEAERLRQYLLQHNPGHLLKPYASFAEAITVPDVQSHVATLRRSHPYEASELLLQSLHGGGDPHDDEQRQEDPSGRTIPPAEARSRRTAPPPQPKEAAPAQEAALPPQYEAIARLESEPHCISWLVRNRVTGRPACLKIDNPDHPWEDEKSGTRREGEILRRLRGCSVVPRLYATGQFEGRSYIETELIGGLNLLQVPRPLSVADVCRVGANIARGLVQIHQAGVVWRDLKPRNVCNPLAEIRFQQFAHAAALEDATWLAKCCGTANYMAPELLMDRPASFASDCYALGVLLYELLAGKPPFGPSLYDILHQALDKIPEDPRAGQADTPDGLGRLVLALLAKQPEDRPGDLEAVAQNLEFFAGLGPAPAPPTAPPQPDGRELDSFDSLEGVSPLAPGDAEAARNLDQWLAEHLAEPAGRSRPPEINLNLVQSVEELRTNAVFDKPPAADPAAAPDDAREEGRTFGSVSIHGEPPAPALPPAVVTRALGAAPPAPEESPESFHKRIREGMQLGPYRILAPIGSGSFGTVYLAEGTQSMLGTRVALKIPRSQSLSQEEVNRYQHEAKLWGALSKDHHPNVLELYDLNRFDGVIAFVMEYVDGTNLAEFAAQTWGQGPFALGEAIRIIRCVAEALRVIHSKRVYHGDLKPANVVIRQEDRAVKVTDFSISRSVSPEGSVATRSVAGTPAYMAPEVWDGKPTLQSDIFALGVIFYELVTGARPFQAADASALEAAIRGGHLPAQPSARRADVPFELERIILRCLEVDVEDRYASIGELIEDLQAADTSQDLVTGLAECILKYSSPEDLTFLLETDLPGKGYRGGDSHTLVIEYCLDEDPAQILMSCFNKAGLARLADRLGARVEEGEADRENYAQAVLRRLGLAGGGSLRGIHDSILAVTNLRHRLEQCRDGAEVAGLVTPAAREYEKVLRDLVRFYGQFLHGRSYERRLVRLARKRVAEYKRDLSRATLGDLVGVLQALNDHLAGDSAEAQQFRKVFHRAYAVPPQYLTGSRVTAVRNAFLHWNETLARASLAKVRDMARDLLTDIIEFLEVIKQEGIYPRVVAVESFVTDRFGRKYILCRNDQGQVEKVFTNVAVNPSRHYFFYPTTNPMRIYPILVPV
jgi:serine/threonine protein kinase